MKNIQSEISLCIEHSSKCGKSNLTINREDASSLCFCRHINIVKHFLESHASEHLTYLSGIAEHQHTLCMRVLLQLFRFLKRFTPEPTIHSTIKNAFVDKKTRVEGSFYLIDSSFSFCLFLFVTTADGLPTLFTCMKCPKKNSYR